MRRGTPHTVLLADRAHAHVGRKLQPAGAHRDHVHARAARGQGADPGRGEAQHGVVLVRRQVEQEEPHALASILPHRGSHEKPSVPPGPRSRAAPAGDRRRFRLAGLAAGRERGRPCPPVFGGYVGAAQLAGRSARGRAAGGVRANDERPSRTNVSRVALRDGPDALLAADGGVGGLGGGAAAGLAAAARPARGSSASGRCSGRLMLALALRARACLPACPLAWFLAVALALCWIHAHTSPLYPGPAGLRLPVHGPGPRPGGHGSVGALGRRLRRAGGLRSSV